MNAYKKGDKIKNGKLLRENIFWAIDTEYQEPIDINDQLNIIIKMIEKNKVELIRAIEDLSLKSLLESKKGKFL